MYIFLETCLDTYNTMPHATHPVQRVTQCDTCNTALDMMLLYAEIHLTNGTTYAPVCLSCMSAADGLDAVEFILITTQSSQE